MGGTSMPHWAEAVQGHGYVVNTLGWKPPTSSARQFSTLPGAAVGEATCPLTVAGCAISPEWLIVWPRLLQLS